MDDQRPNHYEVLGIGSAASPEEIERAYRFSLELYGDGALATYSLLDPEEVKAARARVHEAYGVLSDPVRRHEYDLDQGLGPPGTPPPPRPPAPLRAVGPPPGSPATVIPGPGRGGLLAGPDFARLRVSGSEMPEEETEASPEIAPPAARPVTPMVAPRANPAPPPPMPVPVPAPEAKAVREAPEPAPTPAPVTAGRMPSVLADPITGSALRRFREERGITLREIANQSKVGTRFLEYIEGDRHDMLPAAVYLRGFLQEYARAVGLDPKRTADGYMAQFPRPWPAA